MGAEEKKQKILNVLLKQRVGSSQIKLAETTELSRPTVAKYLQLLEEEGKVKTIEIGGFTLWTSTQTDYFENNLAKLYFDFIQILLETLQEELPDLNWKEIGRSTTRHISLREFIRSEKIEQEFKDFFIEGELNLEKIGEVIRDIFVTICSLFKLGQVEPPIIIKEVPMILLRIGKSKYVNIPSIFELVSGIFEQKVLEDLKVLEIIVETEAHPEPGTDMGYVDFKIKLK